MKKRIKTGSIGLLFANFFFQRLLRINSECHWQVHFTSRVLAPARIVLHGDTYDVESSFARSGGCYIQALNGIEIGEGTLFGPSVKIISANHSASDYGKWVKDKPIVIGKKCWIGAGAIILPGVRLGNGVVVGAGAVVTKSFPSKTVIAGNPAKALRKLK